MSKKIWWDPGHGGADPGAIGNGLHEADLNLKIVKYAMAYLTANYTGFEQQATRLTDKTVELSDRDNAPDAWGADLFISCHINAGGGTGFESHIYTNPSNAAVAFQNVLHAEVLAAMKPFGDIKDRGKKRSNFFVVRETNAPAILTENLFVDTVADAAKLKNEAFIKATGEAHGRAAAKYLGLPEKPKEAPKAEPAIEKKYIVELGAYEKKETAEQVIKNLSAAGFRGAVVKCE